MDHRVLITGGAGFLGRHLARSLAEDHWHVTVLDDLSCPNSSFDCPPLQHERIQCLEGSVLDAALTRQLVSEHRVVVHFASVVGVEETISKPLETVANIQGTLHLVEHLTAEHVTLFGSSADVYGLHSAYYDRPMHEDDHVLFEHAAVNRWVYPKVKALEENLFLQSPGVSVNVRIFNCYGPGMDYPHAKRAVPQFVQRILEEQPLQISGSGRQVRSFCYYEDMIHGLRLALDYAQAQRAPHQQTFNIGHARPVSILELAELMVELSVEVGLLARPLPVRFDEQLYSQSFNDTWDRIPDTRRARQVLGFEPTVELREGMTRTLRYYQRLKQVLLQQQRAHVTPTAA